MLSHLHECIANSWRIFQKYKSGWKVKKCWVTPEAITAKAKTQQERTRHAWHDLSVALNIHRHNAALQPSAPAAVETTEPDDTFELPAGDFVVDRKANGLPVTVLGRGSFGVVGLGNIRRDDGSTELVAVKMAMPNVLADAENRPQIVTEFRKEVRLLGQIDHPNIVQCHGGITRQGDDLVMWIVMEKLEMTLSTAIDDKHLPIGRDDPQTYVELIAGLCSAMAYLHTLVGGKPIVHRDLKPDNIMINNLRDRVVKLVDFGLAKETMSGVGSTMHIKGTREWMAPEQVRVGETEKAGRGEIDS